MRIATSVTLLAAALLMTPLATADHHEAAGGGVEWFDDACVCCKPMHDNAALMSAMKWETHKLSNGLMMVAMPSGEMLDEFTEVCAAMKAKHEAAKPGDPSCGFCNSFGALMGSGAKVEEIKTGFGKVTIITSTDPAVVAKIHAHSDRTQAEMDKMAMAEAR